ncbi:MAG: orotidine-5'-phosphate decarboxylase [Candidatus Omnitrophica bacterium]|nr:orotidine-5'-phosphate decarboxylase [Candidatus Omnitrophota bacterium]
MTAKDKLILALDVYTLEEAKDVINRLKDVVDIYKIGSQLFTACGPEVVRYVLSQGKKVFLDLKFHDIPNTVASAVGSAIQMAKIGENQNSIFMCTVHTQGGVEMMKRAAEAARDMSFQLGVIKPLIVGITVLTSDGKTEGVASLVLERAQLAKKAGLDGVVASSQEAALLRHELGQDFVIVTPGIRPKGADAGDQKRITTPFDAISNGSNYLVVGRPILNAKDPVQAAKDILGEIEAAPAV